MHFGVDYYPEHWPEDRWEKDAELMSEANFDTVRLAEFAWSRIESEEGAYDFSWLDRAIDILSGYQMEIVLGTPTAAPPPWLTEKHPEILPINEDKEIVKPGHRKHYCVNSQVYRDYTETIVAKMAEKYGSDKRVIGWQTDNELGHPVCYCDECREKFHTWLEAKYENLDELNERWGTVFWSHEYTDWTQIPLPNDNPRKGPNPSLHLDYKRFFSESTIEYNGLQVDTLKRNIEDQWVCHNFMPHFPNFDHFRMADDLDLATWDHYPTEIRDSYHEVSAGHDLTYGSKDQPFWVMEEQCSYLTRDKLTPQPRPGETRMWTYQSIAHGADGIIYFRWRPCRFGDEQFHGGVLQYDGSKKSPGYKEIKSVGEEVVHLEEHVDGTVVESDVGILHPFEQIWSMETYRYGSPIDYKGEILNYYKALFDANVNVKFVSLEDEFDDLEILIAPVLPMVNEGIQDKLETYVKRGGRFVCTFRSGIKNYDNVMTDRTFPGRLSDLLGIKIRNFTPLQENQEITIAGLTDTGSYRAKSWVDCVDPEGAVPLAEYEKGWPGSEGYVGLTANDYEDGTAYYVGLSAEEEFYQDLIGFLLDEANIDPILYSAESVEVTKRTDPESSRDLFFVLNHSGSRKTADLDDRYIDLITGKEMTGKVDLKPFDVIVLTRNTGD